MKNTIKLVTAVISLWLMCATAMADSVAYLQSAWAKANYQIPAEQREDAIVIDAATRRNLEIDVNLAGGQSNTLFSVMDRCVTAMGSRLLRRWLAG